MRSTRRCLLLSLLLALPAPVLAATIPGFFNTGVDNSSVVLTTGDVDPHYILIASADGAHPGPAAYACDPIPTGYWFGNNSLSRWLGPAVDENYPSLGTSHPGGDYTYRFSFDLTGFDAATVVLNGAWGVDNAGAIKLNGVTTAIPSPSYNPLTPFTLNSGFVPGINHLDFVVTNYAAGGANPTGLRVQGLTATATPVVGVPLPSGLGAFEVSVPAPTPARGLVRMLFTLPREGPVRIVVRDLAGRAVRTIAGAIQPAGRSQAEWNGVLDDGSTARSGVYFADFEYGGTRLSRRIVWAR